MIGFIILAGLLAAGFFLAERAREEEKNRSIQIRTETEPIFNHFPELPETSELQWCSQSFTGIGPTTVKLYFFAFYDRDVRGELQGMMIEDQGRDLELFFVPDGINGDEKWRKAESPGNPFPLQTGVRESAKLYASIYINETGTILYVEAIGD